MYKGTFFHEREKSLSICRGDARCLNDASAETAHGLNNVIIYCSTAGLLLNDLKQYCQVFSASKVVADC